MRPRSRINHRIINAARNLVAQIQSTGINFPKLLLKNIPGVKFQVKEGNNHENIKTVHNDGGRFVSAAGRRQPLCGYR